MKKTLLICCTIIGFGFISCKKCQTCTTSTTQSVGGFPITTSVSDDYCGDDYDNAPAEVTVDQNVGGIQQTVVIDCVDQ